MIDTPRQRLRASTQTGRVGGVGGGQLNKAHEGFIVSRNFRCLGRVCAFRSHNRFPAIINHAYAGLMTKVDVATAQREK